MIVCFALHCLKHFMHEPDATERYYEEYAKTEKDELIRQAFTKLQEAYPHGCTLAKGSVYLQSKTSRPNVLFKEEMESRGFQVARHHTNVRINPACKCDPRKASCPTRQVVIYQISWKVDLTPPCDETVSKVQAH